MRDFRDYKKRGLSSSDGGRGIVVSAIASPGTLLHTALSSPAASEWDEVTLWAVNRTGTASTLTLEWGGTDTTDQISVNVASGGSLVPVVDRLVLHNGREIRAYGSTADALVIHGSVRRFEQSL
jgi:hypothetical protein